MAKIPYKISVPEAVELKDQMTQLLEKNFIRRSVSTWGARILFQKKDGIFYLYIDF